MLKNISWSSYLNIILIALIIYYLVICLKFYQAEIKDVLEGRYNGFLKEKLGNRKRSIDSNQNIIITGQLNNNDLFLMLNQFMEEINNFFQQASENNLVKPELIYSLQQLVKKYFQIKASPFQSFITNYILVVSSNYSSIHLSKEDLNTLWAM